MERERLRPKEIEETHENPSYPAERSRNEPSQREAVGDASRMGLNCVGRCVLRVGRQAGQKEGRNERFAIRLVPPLAEASEVGYIQVRYERGE